MATNDKTTSAVQQPKLPDPLKPSLSDTQARDSFIAVALREVIAWQLAEGKTNHDQAGVLAVRYANSTMAARGTETASLRVVVSKGVAEKIELGVGTPFPPKEIITDDSKAPPKSIAEIIGEAEPVAEVK